MLLIIINNNYPCQGGTLENPKYPLPQTWSEQIILLLILLILLMLLIIINYNSPC